MTHKQTNNTFTIYFLDQKIECSFKEDLYSKCFHYFLNFFGNHFKMFSNLDSEDKTIAFFLWTTHLWNEASCWKFFHLYNWSLNMRWLIACGTNAGIFHGVFRRLHKAWLTLFTYHQKGVGNWWFKVHSSYCLLWGIPSKRNVRHWKKKQHLNRMEQYYKKRWEIYRYCLGSHSHSFRWCYEQTSNVENCSKSCWANCLQSCYSNCRV